MLAIRRSIVAVALLSVLGVRHLEAQPPTVSNEIGFVEKFALALDRRAALEELIPGTEDYFYFHCLHFQNEMQLAEAEAILTAWKAKSGNTPRVESMETRQALLSYAQNPDATIEKLRTKLNANFNHAPPSKDRAASLPTQLDNSQLTNETRLAAAIARDRSLNQIEDSGLPLLLDKKLSPEQLRALLSRLARADLPRLVDRVVEELRLRDSAGFGWAGVHSLLTLEQLDDLMRQLPNVIENEKFIRAYTAQLAPAEGVALSDKVEMRAYLTRLLKWTRRLPASQNSLKTLVLGNLLRLDLSEGKYDRELFLEYLSVPRSAAYYDLTKFRGARVSFAEMNYRMQPELPLPAMGDDAELVNRYLEHFFANDQSVDAFARYLDRDYLERLFAETKILNGIGDAKTWYAKLSPDAQREVRERIEIRFAPHNAATFAADTDVSLDVELKNVDELVVRVYEINTAAYLRSSNAPIGTAIDLDGLVANAERRLNFSQAADRRHTETIALPEMSGRGVWVVDFLGSGRRSRALVRKGELIAVDRLSDAGHVIEILDETGERVPNAYVEFAGRKFVPEDGSILIPYAEKTQTRNIILCDGDFATQAKLVHRGENYSLSAGFLVDHQSLVAGTQAAIAIRPNLACNGEQIAIRLLENAQLTLTATDADGITTKQTANKLDLEDGDELVHQFLVPQRLVSLEIKLSGKVFNQSRNLLQDVATRHAVRCNGITSTDQIGDFYVKRLADGYRLHVLGRNGEPIPRLPVSVSVKLRNFKQNQRFTLATNAEGQCELGMLEEVESISFSARGINQTVHSLERFHRNWPTIINAKAEQAIELPLGKAESSQSSFTLAEVRRGRQHAHFNNRIEIANGSLVISGLATGDYLLTDHEAGQTVSLHVDKGPVQGQFLVGQNRVLEMKPQTNLIVRRVKTENQELSITIDGADLMTRVHIVANTFDPAQLAGQQLHFDRNVPERNIRPFHESFYVDSLRLDEEYSYILNRQGTKKFPGNMLTQPSVLVHPWEVSVTENKSKQAAKGDAIPNEMAPGAAADMGAMTADGEQGPDSSWKCYDFLAGGAGIVVNLAVEDGKVSLPLDTFAGYSAITIVAVHPTSSDSRVVALDDDEIPVRDQRIREAFDANSHLAQTHQVQFLNANERKDMGDARTRRLQVYASIADVYELYSTILNTPEWSKFQFVADWPNLTEDERLGHYNEMACHELNFFLYHKDPEFFQQVVRPFIQNKIQKQLIDHWLLDEPMEAYSPLWKRQRLNTLEHILLATRSESIQAGTKRWLTEWLAANPLPPEARQQRFEIALSGSALQHRLAAVTALNFAENAAIDGLQPSRGRVPQAFGMGGGGFGGRAGAAMKPPAAPKTSRMKRRESESLMESDAADFFGTERMGRQLARDEFAFFQSLDKTREWAETQYHGIRLANQADGLIPPSSFWEQYLNADGKAFLPLDLDLPVGNVNEALCALAVIDLPFSGEAPKMEVVDGNLFVDAKSPAVVYLESIEQSKTPDTGGEVLVGQDIYLSQPGTSDDQNKPVQSQPLVKGISYRANVVVTNPTSDSQRIQVLTQLPQGAIPLSGSKATRSTSVELQPYSTSQVQYSFYFPAEGKFSHYGAQISRESENLASTSSSELTVLPEPVSADETTWSYIADWGTNEQVLAKLAESNLEELELARIAFRLADREFYDSVINVLSEAGQYEPTIWSYSLKHKDVDQIRQYLQMERSSLGDLGVALDSPLMQIEPAEQMTYEHLEYKPLVVARMHQLGPKPTILNSSFHTQYHRLLDVLAHNRSLENARRLELCYYLLLQNRISEATDWFGKVERPEVAAKMQYDYFDAYLEFYKGNYDRANQIASNYAAYPVPRWKDSFAQITEQVSERNSLLAGRVESNSAADRNTLDPSQTLLDDTREKRQSRLGKLAPTLSLETSGDSLLVSHSNLEQLRVSYYLMDIELLFSRRPFVSQGQSTAPVIAPNVSETLNVASGVGSQSIDIPEKLRNRNVIVEVSAEGISRIVVLTANSLQVNVAEPLGRLQVLAEQGGAPLEKAYVKVYARHRDGSIRFYKDGYTDLRGQFDYATLSTSDLDTAERFSILVMHEELGAAVQEASVPTR